MKALAYFDEGEAADVDAATQRYLSEQAAGWDFGTARIVRAARTLT